MTGLYILYTVFLRFFPVGCRLLRPDNIARDRLDSAVSVSAPRKGQMLINAGNIFPGIAAVLMTVLLAFPAWAEDHALRAGELQGPTTASVVAALPDSRDTGIGSFLLSSLRNPSRASHSLSPADSAGRITVMTRNLYVGASFGSMLGASTKGDIGDRAARIYERIRASQFPRRAEAVADEIVATRPDVVGLQEAMLIVRSSGEPSVDGRHQPKTTVTDYLQILLAALERRNAGYAVAAIVNNTDITGPVRNGGTIRFVDRDVILVRRNLSSRELLVLDGQAKNFEMKFNIKIADNEADLIRGWCSADVIVGGKLIRVVNTHLEEDYLELIHSFQVSELLDGELRTSLPVIALGDFNVSENSTTYKDFLKAGFSDSWRMLHPGEAGFSCCQDEDLLNPGSQLRERIDFILYRGGDINVEDVKLVGVDPSERIPSGQWPSDHAGIVATLSIK